MYYGVMIKIISHCFFTRAPADRESINIAASSPPPPRPTERFLRSVEHVENSRACCCRKTATVPHRRCPTTPKTRRVRRCRLNTKLEIVTILCLFYRYRTRTPSSLSPVRHGQRLRQRVTSHYSPFAPPPPPPTDDIRRLVVGEGGHIASRDDTAEIHCYNKQIVFFPTDNSKRSVCTENDISTPRQTHRNAAFLKNHHKENFENLHG